eukprot:TRINITY_DN41530_c0_g1_i1.p1 TRINITY_DN41530_c0_g1~~TRINITY_DN41530_c0_g1_i1.p1  ORF type:complete len:599 (+),score=126.23 TRINITY_DN41530_c0_g1_i1:104-1900(+)
MPPKAPPPAEFCVTSLQAGKKQWTAGQSGPAVPLSIDFFGGPKSQPRYEVVLNAKMLFGRKRLAFEVQQLDYSKSAIQKLLDKEQELDSRFAYSDEEPKEASMDFEGFIAVRTLSARHSVQVKFEDIKTVQVDGAVVTLHLSQVPTCYVKPAGERRTVNMSVCKDITGGAKTLRFVSAAPAEGGIRGNAKATISFHDLVPKLKASSSRMSALLDGREPENDIPDIVKTPNEKKRRRGTLDADAGSSTKQARRSTTTSGQLEDIKASDGSWLKFAVDRFGLKGPVSNSMTEARWKTYSHERVIMDAAEASLSMHSEEEEEEEEDDGGDKEAGDSFEWPESLGRKPSRDELSSLFSFESYMEADEEHEFALGVIEKIRKTVQEVCKSTCLKFAPATVAQGAYLLGYHRNMDDDTPRTVDARAKIFSPTGSGNYVTIVYENHFRPRNSFTERHSYVWCVMGRSDGLTPSQNTFAASEEEDSEIEDPPRRRSKGADGKMVLFSMDFDEYRRKNPYKTKFATKKQLDMLAEHLFGETMCISPRKVFMLMVRSVGLGQFGECNGWVIAAARKRFKCSKAESLTDSEPIAGDKCADPDDGGCCIM